jgi:phosphoglycerate dehydrogenase-like enzyme
MIYCAPNFDQSEKKLLVESAGSIRVFFEDEIPDNKQFETFLSATICFGNVSRDWLEQTENLKWIQLESVGFGEYQNLKNAESFIMTNLKGFFSVPVAETTLAGILAFYRGTDGFAIHKHRKTWHGAALRPGLRLLQGARVLILGGGHIGRQIKKLLSAFDVQLTIYDRYQPDADISSISDLDGVIPEVNILICCLPETKETKGLLDRSRLNKLKTDALLVNVGRGSAIDEKALIQLLMEQKIGGCVLDVTQQEPIPYDHPLWMCPNTLLTQHTGGGWINENSGKINFFLENLKRFNQGNELISIVDTEKGY